MKRTISYLSFLLSSCFTYGQVEYFEFNNPSVINISEESIDKLTSTTWYGDFILDYGRHDTTKTRIISTQLKYFPDNTYTINNSDKARWIIAKNKYISHSTIDSLKGLIPKFGGIFGIIEINDSLLHLVKLQTSIHDMQRHIYFSKNQIYRQSFCSINKVERDSNKISGAIYIENPTPKQLDSISNLTKIDLFLNAITPITDSIVIQTPDLIFKIKWQKFNTTPL